MMRGVRRGVMLLATGAIVGGGAGAASAQAPSRIPPGAIVQPLEDPQGAELRRHLQTLADNPQSVDALVGAGRASLRAGDVEAALSFFGRAGEVAPRDARVKAGMASAMVQMGEPSTALTLFAEAVALGAPEAEIAGDRGLAFDMTGDPRRAQQDYTLSLRHRDDDEVRRRLALSLAIAGQRDAALRLIDPQLRRHDRAAWRTQAFVLALTGDAAGAARTAETVMPAGTAQAMAPFLARLASLGPAEKALAVHLGHFPANGSRSAVAATAPSADPNALALAMGGPPPATPAQPRQTQTATAPARTTTTTTTRRRPEPARDSSDPYGLRGVRTAQRQPQPSQSQPARQPATQPAQQTSTQPSQQQPARQAQVQPQQPPRQQPVQPPPQQPAPTRWAGAAPDSQSVQAQTQPARTEPQPAQNQPAQPQSQPVRTEPQLAQTRPVETQVATNASTAPGSTVAPGFTLTPSTPQTTRPQPQQPPRGEPLADIEALVQTLPDQPSAPPASPPPAQPQRRSEPVRTAQAEPPVQRPARQRQSRPTQPAHPARHWVQIAGGANRATLPRELARVREAAPEELRGRSAWVTATATSNRLLLGPFASSREAQEFVNRLARRNVPAFAWTSAAGQEIDRLQTGR